MLIPLILSIFCILSSVFGLRSSFMDHLSYILSPYLIFLQDRELIDV